MCKECEEKEQAQIAICKICRIEKPINEMNRQKNKQTSKLPNEFTYTCKVCDFFKRNSDIVLRDGWSKEEYKIIMDSILNEKFESIDCIVPLLINKTLEDLVILLNNELHFNGGKHKIRVLYKCDYCGKKLYLKISEYIIKDKKHFCSYKCNGDYSGRTKSENKKMFERFCQYCGSVFFVSQGRVTASKDKFCSQECSQKSQSKKVKFNCDFCGTECECSPSQYKKSQNHFCSNACSDKYRSKITKEIRQCEICGDKFEISKVSSQRFCSIECQGKWQSTQVGLLNPRFKSILIKCDWCEKEYYEKPYKVNGNAKQLNHFCSEECYREWYAKEWSQREEWKKECAERATQMLCDGIMTKTDTNIQIIVNNLLNLLGIKYENEYNCKYVAIDNALYINDNLLFIECMGTYWHTDKREYKTINYAIQKDRIRLDKIKHTYIKEQYGIEILYLWEKDIIENTELCKQLIQMYISKNGVLDNYHSFNYNLGDDTLKLNELLDVPYMEYDIKEINNLTDLSVKEQMSRKQDDKWTKYKCEYCGKECEELTSHHVKKSHHFCSQICSSSFNKTRKNVLCNNCGKEIEVIKSKFEKQTYFFCNKKCQHEFQQNEGFKPKKYNINKENVKVCNKENSIKKPKKQKFFNCENCGKYTSKNVSDYNKAKHHFCCYKCSTEFRNKK